MDHAHHEGERDVLFPPPPTRRRRRPWRRDSGIFQIALIAGVVLLLAAGAGWWWFRSGADSGARAPTSAAEGPTGGLPELRDPFPAVDSEPLPDLPSLDASDAFVRDLAAELSSRPRWAAWLATDRLVRRFVAAVVRVSAGSSPAEPARHLAPEGAFTVRGSGGARTVIDPASYARYDLPAAIVVSLDTGGTARIYRQLHPLFEAAHRELGFPEGTFDETFARAVRNLVAVEVPEGDVEVVRDEGVYRFRDPELEALSPAAKHLLRMGPENARRVQAKLGELADAMGLGPGAAGPGSR